MREYKVVREFQERFENGRPSGIRRFPDETLSLDRKEAARLLAEKAIVPIEFAVRSAPERRKRGRPKKNGSDSGNGPND